MTPTSTLEHRRAVALSIAVSASEQAIAAADDDPISAHQFRAISTQAQRIARRMRQRAEANHEG